MQEEPCQFQQRQGKTHERDNKAKRIIFKQPGYTLNALWKKPDRDPGDSEPKHDGFKSGRLLFTFRLARSALLARDLRNGRLHLGVGSWSLQMWREP